MTKSHLTRRQFLERSTLAAGAVALGSGALLHAQTNSANQASAPVPGKRTAVDEITLGNTGIKTSRLGMGLGSNNGQTQTRLGREGFNSLIKYAYDQGIRYFDTAASYSSFAMIADAIKGLPREKLFIQSKIMGVPGDALATIDHHRRVSTRITWTACSSIARPGTIGPRR